MFTGETVFCKRNRDLRTQLECVFSICGLHLACVCPPLRSFLKTFRQISTILTGREKLEFHSYISLNFGHWPLTFKKILCSASKELGSPFSCGPQTLRTKSTCAALTVVYPLVPQCRTKTER